MLKKLLLLLVRADLPYRLAKYREKAILSIVWHLPRVIAYWATIRVATEGCDSYPADQTVEVVLKRWSAR